MAKDKSHIKRVNLSLPSNVVYLVKMLAERDGVKLTTKATDLLEQGLESEEDRVLIELAEERLNEIESSKIKAMSSKEFWKGIKGKGNKC